MKKIETLIHSQSWESVREQLSALGIRGTVRDVKTFGYAPPTRGVYRGASYLLDLAAGLELSLVVGDELVEQTVAVLATHGIGQVLVSAVERFEASPEVQPATAALRVPAPGRAQISKTRSFSYT